MKKTILLLSICVVIVFLNCLFNGFVGDDLFLIENNTFFEKLENIKFIFSPEVYNVSGDDIFNDEVFGSGSVAYRPILSLTYFIDDFFWKKNPFGYHLQNLFWHLAVTIIVFLLFYKILSGQFLLAFFSVLLFAVHPLRAEPVCAIGYRADILAAFFLLISFYLYLLKDGRPKRSYTVYLVLSLLTFFLAVLSKESAIVLPFLIISYEFIFRNKSFKSLCQLICKKLFLYWSVAAGYLVLYFFVFPNQALKVIALMGGGLGRHAQFALVIFGHYTGRILCPWMVKSFPPVFVDDFSSTLSSGDIYFAVLFFVFTGAMVWFYRQRKHVDVILFGTFWYIISYLPIANIFPMVTPIAYRFIYLPSIGASLLLIGVLFKICDWYQVEKRRKVFLSSVLCLFCAFYTLSLNSVWKNGFVFSKHLIKDFPQNPRGYLLSGLYFSQKFSRQEAIENFEKASKMGLEDPRLFYNLGNSYELIGEKEKVEDLFRKGIVIFPENYLCYFGLGKFLIFEKKPKEAVLLLNKALEITFKDVILVYLIQGYRLLGDDKSAWDVYMKSKGKIRETNAAFFDDLLEMDVESLPIAI